MTPAEKILREALETTIRLYPGYVSEQIAREAIAKADALPIDYRLPDYLQDDPWALQMVGYVDGLKEKMAEMRIAEEKSIEVSDKIVTDWIAEVGKDEHGPEWDDLADLKNRIAKALTKA